MSRIYTPDCFTVSYIRAIHENNVAMMAYIYEEGLDQLVEDVSCFAAMKGNFECLKFAHERGCPMPTRVLRLAVGEGSLECLRYAWENGCQLPNCQHLLNTAAGCGHLECLKYLIETAQVEYNVDDLFTIRVTLHLHDNFHCFEYLHHYTYKINPESCQHVWKTTQVTSTFFDQINLDERDWRTSMFKLDVSNHPALHQKILDKKQLIVEQTEACKSLSLIGLLVNDIIDHALLCYI
jgi:hypothetical protein